MRYQNTKIHKGINVRSQTSFGYPARSHSLTFSLCAREPMAANTLAMLIVPIPRYGRRRRTHTCTHAHARLHGIDIVPGARADGGCVPPARQHRNATAKATPRQPPAQSVRPTKEEYICVFPSSERITAASGRTRRSPSPSCFPTVRTYCRYNCRCCCWFCVAVTHTRSI